jgi:putative two-component system response regulator
MEGTDKAKILIVDDEEANVKLLSNLCESLGYETMAAYNGSEAVEMAGSHLPDLIFMDLMMPGMDGFEATERLKKDSKTEFIPIIIVTALDSRQDRLMGISKGADDFLTKPIDYEEVSLRTNNTLKIKKYHDLLHNHNELLEKEVREKTVELRDSYIDTIHRLTKAAEYKDEETAAHIKRSGYYAAFLAEKLGWPKGEIEKIFYAAPMHDIGKVGIPSEILLKRGGLSPEEFMLMKTHTTIGKKILTGSVSPITKMAERIAECHHERWDGNGYPNGLKGEDIPYEARIYNICDQYDALRSVRPYKPAFDHDKTFKILTEGDGRTTPSHFDPKVLGVFKESADEFNNIFVKHQNA